MPSSNISREQNDERLILPDQNARADLAQPNCDLADVPVFRSQWQSGGLAHDAPGLSVDFRRRYADHRGYGG